MLSCFTYHAWFVRIHFSIGHLLKYGNCLFNARSRLLIYNESLAELLRLLICLELYINAEKYHLHPLFGDTEQTGTFCTFNSIFVACISNLIFDSGLPSNVKLARKTAMSIIESTVYVPFLAVLALVNVLDISIQLYTKPIIDQRLMGLYNNKIHPFERSISDKCIYLFWGSTSGSDKLDHFVPLLDETAFELLPEDISVELPGELEPFNVKILEEIFVQFGPKLRALQFT